MESVDRGRLAVVTVQDREVTDAPGVFPPWVTGHEVHLWDQYQKAIKMAGIDPALLGAEARQIAGRIHQVDLRVFKSPWNVLYASHEPQRRFTELLLASASLFDAFVRMPDRGVYSFPYSYKPSKAARTHTANENFNPDYFIRVHGTHDILVVEVKDEGDDSSRNRAKCRDGQRHFDALNARLAELSEPWRYCFYFLSPEDQTHFFEQVRNKTYAGWKSGLMQALGAQAAEERAAF